MSERRIVSVSPAFHRCHPDPSKSYGISDPRMRWTLYVDDDAISWEVFTGWGMPDEAARPANPTCDHPRHGSFPSVKPVGGAVDWHFATPVLSEHHCVPHCVVLGGPCYPDVGYLVGGELFDVLRTEGDEAVWGRLRGLLAGYRTDIEADAS